MTLHGVRVALALLVLVSVGAPSMATAAEPLIDTVKTPRDGVLEITLAPTLLPPGTRPQDASVRVSIDGQDAATTKAATAGAAVQRTMILVMDSSGSMRGARLQQAKVAAAQLVAALPADVRVGLVRFASNVELLVPPTRDRGRVQASIGELRAAGDTRLYDAVPVALSAAGTTGNRRVVILSDGRDDGSALDLRAARGAISASGTTVDVVDASSDGSATTGLKPLADAGGGRALQASSTSLSQVFNAVAQSYLTRLTLRSTVPPQLAGRQVRVEVVIESQNGPRAEVRSVTAPGTGLPPAQAAVPTLTPPRRTTSFWLMLSAVFVGVLLLLVLAITTGDTRATNRRRTWRAMTDYSMHERVTPSVPEVGPIGDSRAARSALALADRAVERRGSGERLALALDQAGLSWRPNEWMLACVASTLTGAALTVLLFGGGLLALVLGAAMGLLIPRTWLSHRARMRQKAFLDAMPDALQLLSASLSTGYSLAQAVDAVAQEGSEPLAGELGRALAEARIGLPLEDALDSVADRMECEDFRWVVMAIRVQREVGGNLAEVLGRVCTTMRDRASLRRQVRALSAEGRFSAYILIALPLTMGAFMFTFRRDYFRPMYTETVGILALVVMAMMLVIGTLWMNKLVKVEL